MCHTYFIHRWHNFSRRKKTVFACHTELFFAFTLHGIGFFYCSVDLPSTMIFLGFCVCVCLNACAMEWLTKRFESTRLQWTMCGCKMETRSLFKYMNTAYTQNTCSKCNRLLNIYARLLYIYLFSFSLFRLFRRVYLYKFYYRPFKKCWF